MNFKNALPWLLAVTFLAAAGFLFSKTTAQDKKLMQLRAENQEIEQLRESVAEMKNVETRNSVTPLTKKEREELIRLRNETGLLRRDKQKLEQQFQQAELSRTRLQQAQESQSQQALQIQQLQQQNQQLAQQSQEQEATKAMNVCINNLRQIDGAKQQWALENKQTGEASVAGTQIAPYFRNSTVPVCPAGGTYTLNPVNATPTCTTPGHALPE